MTSRGSIKKYHRTNRNFAKIAAPQKITIPGFSGPVGTIPVTMGMETTCLMIRNLDWDMIQRNMIRSRIIISSILIDIQKKGQKS